jgi:hypothetical protein
VSSGVPLPHDTRQLLQQTPHVAPLSPSPPSLLPQQTLPIQVLVALGSRGYPPSSALAQLYFDVSLPGLPSASPRAVAAVLQALERTAVQPDPAWLQALCDAVHAGAAGYDAVQLGTVASALAAFEQGGMRQAWLTDCSDYLRGLQP